MLNLQGNYRMELSEAWQGYPRSDDRNSPEIYVEIPGNDAIHTDNICIGKLLSARPMKTTAIHNVLQHAWAKYGGVRVQELTGEVILFEFKNDADLQDALDLSPWAIHGTCLSLQKWKEDIKTTEVKFHIVQFWVQIHGLELDKFSVQNARKLGGCIGEVKEIDEIIGPMGIDRDYLRIKVDVDTTCPLLAGIWYTRKNGKKGRASIRYERLPDFCFGCGRIGHSDRVCRSEIATAETIDGGPMYGPWTRVDRPRKRGQKCRMIGQQGTSGGNEEGLKKKTWKELMKEKEERERARSMGGTQKGTTTTDKSEAAEMGEGTRKGYEKDKKEKEEGDGEELTKEGRGKGKEREVAHSMEIEVWDGNTREGNGVEEEGQLMVWEENMEMERIKTGLQKAWGKEGGGGQI